MMALPEPCAGLAWPVKQLDTLIVHASGSPPSSASTQAFAGAAGSSLQLPTLPRGSICLISGNNRTKSSLIGLQAVVKKATGLGGWHWLVLPNGEEVKLQRNALQVIELGQEDSQESSEEEEEQDPAEPQTEILDRPRIRRPPRSLSPVPDMFKPSPPRPSSSGSGSGHSSGARFHPYSPPSPSTAHAATATAAAGSKAVDVWKLETASLRRYRRVHQLADVAAAASKDELASAVDRHFRSQMVVDEGGVLLAFCAALRRRSSSSGGAVDV